MKIGLISDTHGYLDSRVPELFRGVDHILHAGDIGSESVLDELRAIAPVTAVLGNTDGELDGRGYRTVECVKLGEKKFFLVHVGHPRQLAADIAEMIFDREKPDLVVFGHSHEPERLLENGISFFNPGSAGRARFNKPRCVAIARIGPGGRIEAQWLSLE